MEISGECMFKIVLILGLVFLWASVKINPYVIAALALMHWLLLSAKTLMICWVWILLCLIIKAAIQLRRIWKKYFYISQKDHERSMGDLRTACGLQLLLMILVKSDENQRLLDEISVHEQWALYIADLAGIRSSQWAVERRQLESRVRNLTAVNDSLHREIHDMEALENEENSNLKQRVQDLLRERNEIGARVGELVYERDALLRESGRNNGLYNHSTALQLFSGPARVSSPSHHGQLFPASAYDAFGCSVTSVRPDGSLPVLLPQQQTHPRASSQPSNPPAELPSRTTSDEMDPPSGIDSFIEFLQFPSRSDAFPARRRNSPTLPSEPVASSSGTADRAAEGPEETGAQNLHIETASSRGLLGLFGGAANSPGLLAGATNSQGPSGGAANSPGFFGGASNTRGPPGGPRRPMRFQDGSTVPRRRLEDIPLSNPAWVTFFGTAPASEEPSDDPIGTADGE